MTSEVEPLSTLLREAGPAHHKAFIATDGADPDWPLWYAAFLFDKVQPYFNGKFTQSELVCLLLEADQAHRQKAPETDWARYYALFLSERYG